MLKSYRMSYTVVLDGFSYDDVSKIAKDYGLSVSQVVNLYNQSVSAQIFEAKFAKVVR